MLKLGKGKSKPNYLRPYCSSAGNFGRRERLWLTKQSLARLPKLMTTGINKIFSRAWPCQYYCVVALPGLLRNIYRNSWMGNTQKCHVLFWTNTGRTPPPPEKAVGVQQFAHYLINHPSKKEQDILGTTWEVSTKLISNVLLWTPTHGHTNFGRHCKVLHKSI